jgi:hypothetical protein
MNPALTIMQLELALNNLHNTMVDKDGKLVLDDGFLERFDDLMYKLNETRAIAQKMRPKEEVDGIPAFLNNNKIGR